MGDKGDVATAGTVLFVGIARQKEPSPLSQTRLLLSCLLPLASCILLLASCFLPLASCILLLASCFLPQALNLALAHIMCRDRSEGGVFMSKYRRVRAYTVLRSPAVTRFFVRLLSKEPVKGIVDTNLFIGRAYGQAITLAGGIPAGASGSPVFRGKKILGAVSYLLGGDPFLVGITPQAEMLALASEPHGPTGAAGAEQLPQIKSNIGLPVGNGFTSVAAKKKLAQRFGGLLCAGASPKYSRCSKQFFPGSPVGAAMMIGDLRLGFIGTVTWVNQSEVFAFGHPLLYAGPCQYPLTTATIITTARGYYPNKLAVLGEVAGTVLQDRAAGIYGRLGQMPSGLVTVTLEVSDEDRKVTKKNNVQVIHNAAELPFLVYVAALETMAQAMNRTGPGTANWQWIIYMVGLAEPVVWSTVQYSFYNIGSDVASSIFPLLEEPLRMGMQVVSVSLTAKVVMAEQVEET